MNKNNCRQAGGVCGFLIKFAAMKTFRLFVTILVGLWLSAAAPLHIVGKPRYDRELLRRVMDYPQRFADTRHDTLTTNVYMKFRVNINRRNPTLMAVPTLFYLARDGRRNYFGECYDHVTYYRRGRVEAKRKVSLSTVYHRHNTLSVLHEYLLPDIYDAELFKGRILSPLCRDNKRFYRYRTIERDNGQTKILVRPKLKNTQLVSGYVLVDNASARVINFELEGEYDMIHFRLLCRMNEDGEKSLRPKQCDVTAKVSVTGNRIFTWFTCVYDLPRDLPDSIDNSEDLRLMQSVRPIPLTPDEERVMADFNSARNARIQAAREQAVRDSLAGISPKAKKENWAKYVFWDIIGDNMLNRIHADLGQNRQGHLRVGPIFNPLYFGFTRRKGLIYKFDIRLNYNFTPNRDLSMRVKMGYSFRQRHTYFNIPFNFNFNKRRNGYVRVDFGNGNRITNSRVLEEVKAEKKDSINWGKMHLDYFKDMNLKMGVNYDVLKNRLGVQGGFVAHRRSAVHKQGFIAAGKPTVYKTVAPYLRLQYRPWGDEGPILTSDYERSFKGLCGSMTNYERWEFDGQFLHKMSRMRAWSMRGGVGLYSSKGKTDYFLDYTNFRENYIPNGWNDDWSGEFELLNSNWYNASDYYVRLNSTYEAPLLLLSWIPVVGQVVEKERIYISALSVRKYTPYFEAGYGFTNRLFSIGIFGGWSPRHFEGVGVKFGFELFNNW